MKPYSPIYSRFWNSGTGKEIVACGTDMVTLAIYSMSCPSAHMGGIYYCPVELISSETGIEIDDVLSCIDQLENLNFLKYDTETKMVWVKTMAEYQANFSNAKDNKHTSVINHIKATPNSFLKQEFAEFYGIDPSVLHIGSQRISKGLNKGLPKGHGKGPFPIHSFKEEVLRDDIGENPGPQQGAIEGASNNSEKAENLDLPGEVSNG